jgi:hypothetical protein
VRSDACGDVFNRGCDRRCFEAAAIATERTKYFQSAIAVSLSLGERAGVRAVVIFCPAGTTESRDIQPSLRDLGSTELEPTLERVGYFHDVPPALGTRLVRDRRQGKNPPPCAGGYVG